jgi:uncharacterized protein YcfJ
MEHLGVSVIQTVRGVKMFRRKYWKSELKGFCIGFFGFGIPAIALAAGGAVVTDHYKEVVYLEPYTIEVCEQQQVANPDDLINSAFWGAIFGAVVGDAIDEDSGKLPGAIIGAAIGAEEAKKNSTTTAMVCRQETRQTRTVRNIYSHSTIEFEYEGSWYDINFTKR